MNQVTESEQIQQLQGAVERVTFHSDSGFCVLRAKVKGQRDLVTIVGTAASISAGEHVKCRGIWNNDKKHGLQFKAFELHVIPPTNIEGIEKYLASGMIKGIGQHYAKQLVTAFGETVFDVIDHQPERLLKLPGIGSKRLKTVVDSWKEQKVVREIMVFLHSHGVGTARAVRIYKTYGDTAIEKVRENPYCLALDIYGIGFKTADELAQRLGIARDAMIRAQAGVRHALQTLCDQGHCAAERETLVAASHELLEISIETIEQAIEHEVEENNLVAEIIDDKPCIYLITLFQAEKSAADQLKRLNTAEPPWGKLDCTKAIPWVEQKTGLNLSDSQKQAIETVLQHKLAIITGGPGVGKTTLVNSLLLIIRAKRLTIELCAPTGRAAKRLTETTGLPAKTIHRLLEFDPQGRNFKHDQDHQLALDVLVIDESSMLDTVLLCHLVKAIPSHAAVIFVGDIDQLPSVGPGAVLTDLIQSNAIITLRLTEIFRQAAHSKIIMNAHRINQGEFPITDTTPDSDFYTVFAETPEAVRDKLVQLVCERIPKHLNCDPIRDIQVLTPMHNGGLGSRGLNIELQQQLNGHSEPKVTRYGCTFAPGDKVIQTVNNYDKDIFNGDIGFVQRIDLEIQTAYIQFDQRILEYTFDELDEVSLAYAISIHKSQGSEFPVVVMPLVMQHYTLLARNLLYTGVTRGKQLVILMGQKKAVAMAINNNKSKRRITKLAQRLQNT